MLASNNYEYSEDEIHELEEVYENLIDINNLPFSEYSHLFFLSEFEKKSLHHYIRRNWGLKSVYELAYILGFTIEKAQLLAQFVCVKPIEYTQSPKDLIKKGRHEISTFYNWQRMNSQQYSKEFAYSGLPLKTNIRYRFSSYKKLYWGVTLKNDMGEASQKGPLSPQFDYKSAYIQYKDNKHINNIIVGDYEVKLGQGLAIWQGGFYAKSMGYSPIKRSEVLKKHSSSNEFTYMRGIGLSTQIKALEITPFLSFRKIDGYITDSLSNTPFYIYKTGLHRSENEITHAKQIQHNTFGLNLNTRINKLNIGATYVLETNKLANIRSQENTQSINYDYKKPRYTLFGEAAISKGLRLAQTHGIQYTISENVSSCLLYRKFDKAYNAIFSKAFSEQANIGNEQALYSYVETRINSYNSLRFAIDAFKMPKATSTYMPRKGAEISLQWKYINYKDITINGSYGYEYKAEDVSTLLYKNAILESKRMKAALKIEYLLNEKLRFSSQIKFGGFKEHGTSEFGHYISQDIQYTIAEKSKLNVRFSSFNAPYNIRLYAWEPDVTYAFSTPQVLYSGQQLALVYKTNINRNWKLQAKASVYFYNEKEDLPEYYSAYKNSNKKNMSVMCMYVF